jgi:hypothetical protein
MCKLLIAIIVALCSLPVSADDLYEYGSSSELRSVKKYYIDAGEDLDLRNILAERLSSVGIKVVEQPEDADHWIIFRWSGSFCARTISIKRQDTRPRLLLTYRGVDSDLDDLPKDAGKAIAKRLREVNGSN